ncbi:hypothetical protein [Evansella tamaricis]|uniref:Pyrroline-5-carboxylate reductase catalytic N-terminal domain-containing protein n=1 Tax=Evansella tamaricis TaxID=2069301 RepID=A0ABS6JK26_9BACI|nr:hypothetical protein [Evansella tamaricis]MBU9713745.1 hypothetical protein [Evansella tamaricis]
MMMIVGFGRFAKAILELLPEEKSIGVFSRSKEKVLKNIKGNLRISWISPEFFYKEKEVWLLLPAESIEPFLQNYASFFSEETVFFLCATKKMAKDIEYLLENNQKVIPVKFITQADELKIEKRGMVAVPPAHLNYQSKIKDIFGGSLKIVAAKEEDVLHLNLEATRKGVELVEDLRKDMGELGIPKEMVDQAAQQIIPGVIRGYIRGDLGGFAKQIVEDRRKKEDESG